VVAIGHKEKYLRGRSTDEIDDLLRAGAARVGVTGMSSYPTEVASLEALVELAEPGDVVGLMCHAEREQVYEWLEHRGATADGPEQLRDKVGRAAGRA
jgi:cyanophycin synthetase